LGNFTELIFRVAKAKRQFLEWAMKIKLVKIFLTAGYLALSAVCLCRASIVTFNFNGSDPGKNSPWNTGTTIDPNVTTTGFTLGGVSDHAGDNRFNATKWSTGTTLASAITGNDYFGFILTPVDGYVLDLDSAAITFTLEVSGTGPHAYALMSSLDGFGDGEELQNGTFLAGAQTDNFSYTFAASGFDDISSPIEFRIYGYDASSGPGTMSVNAFSLGGTVVPAPVPEPAKTGIISAMSLLAILGLDFWRRRHLIPRRS
jgi:hypothetical protein